MFVGWICGFRVLSAGLGCRGRRDWLLGKMMKKLGSQRPE